MVTPVAVCQPRNSVVSALLRKKKSKGKKENTEIFRFCFLLFFEPFLSEANCLVLLFQINRPAGAFLFK